MTEIEQLEQEAQAIQQRIDQRKANDLHRRKTEWRIITLIVAEQFEVDPERIFSRTRFARPADARQVAMAMIRRLFPHAEDEDIAAFFERERTTVAAADKTVTNKCSDSKFKAKLDGVEKILLTRFADRQGKATNNQRTSKPTCK